MRNAIYGAGSLGTVLGAYVWSKGEEIDLINRNRSHVDALNANGAHIVGKVNFTQKVRALTPEQMTGKYDVIFLLTKQQENKKVVEFLADYLADDGVIVTLQNGLPEMCVASVVGEKRTLGCTVGWGATMLGAGEVELTSEPDALYFSLGTIFNEKGNRFDEAKRVLSLMGTVLVEDNFIGSRWSKLLINSAFSGMSAICGATFGEVAKAKTTRRVAQSLIKEIIDVTKAGGVTIEKIQGKDVVKLLDYNNAFKKRLSFFIIPIALKKHKNIKASMLQDIEKGKKCEVEAINGVVCEYGDSLNFDTPFNDRVVEIVHKIEAGELKPQMQNYKLFDDLIK